MKLAFTTLACPDWSWKEVIRRAVEYGYQGVEWRLVDGEIIRATFPRGLAEQIGEAVRAAGLEVCALDSSAQFAFPPGGERDEQIAEARGMVELAQAMGAPILRIMPGTYPQTVQDADAAQWVREALTELLPAAQEAGVTLTLETHNHLGWQRRMVRGTTSSSFIADVLSSVPSPFAGVQWDLGNPYEEGERAAETWRHVRERLVYVHTKDMRPRGDCEWEYVAMGEGVLPLSDAITWLHDAGFRGWLSYEWEKKWHPELAEPEISLPQYISYMRPLLSQVMGG